MQHSHTIVPVYTHIRTHVILGLFCALFFVLSPLYAKAADLRSTTAYPTNGTTFYDTENVTFMGAAENVGGDYIMQGGYADVEIDWNSNGGPEGPMGDGHDVHYNAYNDSLLNDFSAGFVKPLEMEVSAPLPLGTHRYRFNVDTNDMLPETNEANNRSSWVSFTIIETPFAPTISFTASQSPIDPGNSTTLTWTTSYANACTKSSNPAGWAGSVDNVDSSESVSPLVTTTYTLDCTGPGGSASKSFVVDVNVPLPSINFSVSSNNIVSGDSTQLTWSSTNANSCAKSSSPAGWVGTGTTGDETVSPVVTTTYTLECTGPGGSVIAEQTVTVNITPPTVNFSIAPTTVPVGGTVSASWNVTGAVACFASGGSGWAGSKNPVSGNQNLTANASLTYYLACGNTSGTTTKNVVVNVSGAADLITAVVSGGSKIVHTAVPTEGQPTFFQGKVHNNGTGVTATSAATLGIPAPFKNRFMAQWGWTASVFLSYPARPALDPGLMGEPYDQSVSWTPDRSGTMEMQYCADQREFASDQLIFETSESNNCATRLYDVLPAPGGPRLVMSLIGGTMLSSSTNYKLNRIGLGASATIRWEASGATSCNAAINGTQEASWSGIQGISGSAVVSPTATSTYSLVCTDAATGRKVVRAVRLGVILRPPQILSFTVASSSIERGSSATLTWLATSSATCTASSIPANSDWSGLKNRNGGTQVVTNVAADTQFTLTCTSPTVGNFIGGSVSQNINVTVYEPPPQITLSANPNPITPIDDTTLTWSVANADTCTALGGWSGAKAVGNGVTEVVSPDVSTLYQLSCTGPGGTLVEGVTVTVAQTAPIIAPFTVSDNIVISGESAILTWDVVGATSCTATQGTANWLGLSSGTLVSGGNLSISPLVDTTYQLECTGPWGTAVSAPLTVRVIPEADIQQFRICPPVGNAGCVSYDANAAEPVRISLNPSTPQRIDWDVDDADFCFSAAGPTFSTGGAVNGTDSVTVPAVPGNSYSYTLTCGTAGRQTNSATIIVDINPVQPNIWVSERVVRSENGQIEVFWDTNNGDQSVCSLSGGGLTDAMLDAGVGTDEGSTLVTVSGLTTFTLTCGTETDTETVEISPSIWES